MRVVPIDANWCRYCGGAMAVAVAMATYAGDVQDVTLWLSFLGCSELIKEMRN